MCNICGQPSLNHPTYSRRNFLRLASVAAAGLALSGRDLFAAGEIPKPQNVLSPHEALERLKKGNARYSGGEREIHDFAMDRAALAKGQNPFAGILSCSDSRVAPEYTFDAGRGDLFVVREAGNYADKDAIASLEYAVEFLGAPLIVVLGHEKCGAIDATIKVVKDGVELPGHLPYLVDHFKPAVEAAQKQSGDLLGNAIRENVLRTADLLRNTSPILSRYVEQKKLLVVGGTYKLETGKVEWL